MKLDNDDNYLITIFAIAVGALILMQILSSVF